MPDLDTCTWTIRCEDFFGDGKPLSTAYTGMEHFRNAPPLYNLRHRVRFLWDGRLGNGAHAEDGIYVLLKETIDNSIDEFMMGGGRKIDAWYASLQVVEVPFDDGEYGTVIDSASSSVTL